LLKKDDEEYQIDNPPTSRRKTTRKPKEKKTDQVSSPTDPTTTSSALATIPSLPLHLPIIPMIAINNQPPENVEEEDMKECMDLLLKIMEYPVAEAFLIPVDFVGLELFHYPKIVKNPMDLGTIKNMLIQGSLENPGHFADHVKLVFKNAMEFNQPGSGIYNDAEALLATFEEEFKKLCDKWSGANKEDNQKETENEEKDKIEIEQLQQSLATAKSNITVLKKNIDALKKQRKNLQN